MSSQETKDLLSSVLQDSKMTFRVMIDALDECDQPEKLLGFLRDVSHSAPGKLELLVTSRHDVEVKDKFPDCGQVDLNTAASAADMLTFIKKEVQDREDDERLLKGNRPDLEEKLIKLLDEKAGGMYTLPTLQPSTMLLTYPPKVSLGTASAFSIFRPKTTISSFKGYRGKARKAELIFGGRSKGIKSRLR